MLRLAIAIAIAAPLLSGCIIVSTELDEVYGLADRIAVMYAGRIGPFTLVAALALRTVSRRFDYPTERPFIG